GAGRDQRVAVGTAGGDLVADVPGGRIGLRGAEPVGLAVGGRRLRAHHRVAAAAELFDRGVRVAQGLAVPAVLVLDGGDALTLHRAGDGRDGLAVCGGRLLVGLVDGGDVMAVDLE